VDGERRQIVGETCRCRGVLSAELTDEDPQPVLSLGGAGRPVERRPVRRPDPGVEARPLRQLGQDVAEAMDCKRPRSASGHSSVIARMSPGAPSLTTRSGLATGPRALQRESPAIPPVFSSRGREG